MEEGGGGRLTLLADSEVVGVEEVDFDGLLLVEFVFDELVLDFLFDLGFSLVLELLDALHHFLEVYGGRTQLLHQVVDV